MGMLVLSFMEYSVFETNILGEFFVRRILAVPGFLNITYWDYFSEHEKVLLTDSIGRYVSDPVYDLSAPFLIGIEYLNDVEANANTGIWMGGFAHFGVIGVLITSAIAGLILGLIDNLTRINYFMFGTLACTYIGINWSEQMLHTSMLTGGVIYILFFIFIIRSSQLIPVEARRGIG